MNEETGCRSQSECRLVAARQGLLHLIHKLSQNLPVTVAFLGGSITEGYGASDPDGTSWRALTEDYFKTTFPDKIFHFVNAGVGGTDSAFGAHRLREHVLKKGPVDLLFIEFAVNDEEDRERSMHGMEGIVRQIKRLSPQTDLCFLYAAADKNLVQDQPFNIAVHEEIAEYYGIPSVNFAGGIRDLIGEGRSRWEELAPDRTHPNDRGYACYAKFLKEYLDKEISVPGRSFMRKNEGVLPAVSLNPDNYEFGDMLDIQHVDQIEGFHMHELTSEPLINWRFPTTHLVAGEPGAELVFSAWGRGAGLLLLCGPDSGIFEYSLNGADFESMNLFDDWCLHAFRPVIALFPEAPVRERMKVIVRNTGRKDRRSTGTMLRIMKFLFH